MKLVQLSDIHLHPKPLAGYESNSQFRACMEHVSKYHSDADLVVISGDLTHIGDRESYQELRSILADHEIKPRLMMGNHDRRATFLSEFPETPTDEDGFVQYVETHGNDDFLFLDSIDDGHHPGLYDSGRRQWLSARLEESREAGRRAFLIMHHNPVETGVADAQMVNLREMEAFQELLAQNRDVIRHILFGHCHYTLSGSVRGIPFSAPRGTSHPCWPEFSGQYRTGIGPIAPEYNVVLIDPYDVVVHTIDFTLEDQITYVDHTSGNGH